MAAAARALEEELEMDEDSPWGHIKCPICLELYSSNPKILPCAHLICQRCLINWVTANDKPATCPVCRYDITEESICRLPATLTAEQIAEALPTDSTIIVMVECVKVFEEPHYCVKCRADANSFCLDCFVKFCKKCRRKHSKATTKMASKAAARLAPAACASAGVAAADPAAASQSKSSTGDSDEEECSFPLSNITVNSSVPYIPPKKHLIEMLAELTPQRLAAEKREKCRDHPGLYFVDYFCTIHSKGVCLQCINADHPSCKIITIDEAAENSRKVLREQADRLKREEELLRQEEENIRVKEEEAKVMAEKAREEIDAAMDMIQFRLRDEQAKLKREMAEANSLPPKERLHHQSELVHAFSDKLKEIVSLQEAEAALHRYEQYSRENVAAINARTEALVGGRRGQNQQRRIHHHHHHNQRQPRHHHHRHVQQQPAAAASVTSQLQTEAASLNSIVDEVTSDLEQAILGVEAVQSLTAALHGQMSEAQAAVGNFYALSSSGEQGPDTEDMSRQPQ